MGIATGTPLGLVNNMGAAYATRGPSSIGTYNRSNEPAQANFSQSDNQRNIVVPKKKSFFVGAVQDLIKTMSRVIWGGMLNDSLNTVLKDANAHLAGAVHSNFMEGFGSRLGADLVGALSERMFNGETSILGLRLPKIPAELSSQLLTNLWVKGWRLVSNAFNQNRRTTEADKSPEMEKYREYFDQMPWVKFVKNQNLRFKKYIKPILEKVSGLVFGVREGKVFKDANGKDVKEPAVVNWKHLLSVGFASLGLTALLPKDTQQFGYSGIYNAKGGWRSIFRVASSMIFPLIGRLEGQAFRNVLGMNPNGYSGDACIKTAVREKMLVPIVQAGVDAISALITRFTTKFIPLNGAFIATLLRIPAETIATLASSSLTGLAAAHRVPAEWAYLGSKYWKPVAKLIEKVSIPLFNNTFNLVYRHVFGMLPTDKKLAEFGIKYKDYDKESAGDDQLCRFKNNNVFDDIKLLATALMPWKIIPHIKNAFVESHKYGEQVRAECHSAKANGDSEASEAWMSGRPKLEPGQVLAQKKEEAVKKQELVVPAELPVLAAA